MTDSQWRDDYRRHAGFVSWPRTLLDLSQGGKCPACFTPSSSPSVCPVCGLDLAHPAAAELVAISGSAASLLDRRLEIIGLIRFETDAAARARTEASAVRATATTTPSQQGLVAAQVRESVPLPREPLPLEPALREAPPREPALRQAPPRASPSRDSAAVHAPLQEVRQRRTSSVQLVMLIVGVSALSVGAIFFLVYAFINYGIGWRSAIIGSITVAAFATATLLRRLRATAEGIAAFAVVLVYLDAYAVRANDFFGAAGADPLLFWGSALVLSSIGFLLWHRLSGLRVPSVAGFGTFAPGIGLLVGGVAADAPGEVRAWLILASVAAGGLVHGLAASPGPTAGRSYGGRPERAIVLGTTIFAVVLASATAVILEPDGADATAAVLALTVTAAIAGAHIGVLRLRRHPSDSPQATDPGKLGAAGSILAAIIGLDLASTGFVAILHGAPFLSGIVVPCITAAAVTLALELVSRRARDRTLALSTRVAAWSALVVASIATAIPLAFALMPSLAIAAIGIVEPWTLGPSESRIPFRDDLPLAIVALGIVIAIAAIAWAAGAVLRSRLPWLAWSTALLLLLAAPLLLSVSLVMAALFTLAVAAVALLVASRTAQSRLPIPSTLRAPLIGLLAGATVLGWCVGWTSASTWAIAVGMTILITLTSRALSVAYRPRAVLLGVAAILAILMAGTAGLTLSLRPGPQVDGLPEWTGDATRFAQVAAVLLLLVSASPIRRFASALEKRTLFWIGSSVAALATSAIEIDAVRLVPIENPLVGDPWLGLAVHAALVIGALAWIVPGDAARFRPERIAASVSVTVVGYLLLGSVADAIGLSQTWQPTTAVVAALVTSAVSIALVMNGGGLALRAYRELGVAVVAAPAVAIALMAGLADLGAPVPRSLPATDGTAWLVLILAAVTAVLVSMVQQSEKSSAVIIGIATALLPLAAAFAASQVGPTVLAPGTFDPLRSANAVAVVLVLACALPLGRIAGALDRRTIFWVAGIMTTITAGVLHIDRAAPGSQAVSLSALTIDLVLLAALLLWVGLRGTAAFRVERMSASIAIAPAIYLVIDSFAAVLRLPEFARSVAPITAALLAAAGSLAVTLLRPSPFPRRAREVGIALVAVPAVLGAMARGDESTWLVLLLASVTVVLVSVSGDGLFASSSPRKHVGWAAIGLATAGLWWRLGEDEPTVVEAWVLPVAGLLFIVALLIWRAESRSGGSRGITRGSAAPVVALAALLTAIVPVAVAGASGPPSRALVVAAVSAALLILGSFVVGSSGIRPYLDAACLAGGIGVIVTAVARAAFLVRADSFELDAWLGGALVVLTVAGFGLASTTATTTNEQQQPHAREPEGQQAHQHEPELEHAFTYARLRATGAVIIAVMGLVAVAAFESIAMSDGSGGILRAVGVTMLLAAVHVLAFLVDAAPFTRLVAWLSISYAAVVAGVGILAGSLDPIEAGTVPIAVALLATGVVQLERDSKGGSWAWLAPGLTILLLPSLVATVEDRPVWRLVAIGVVGIAAIVIGATRRLQAPFVLGSVVVLVHVIATFTPQIRAAYQSLDWWLWLALGGILLIVLAARYEQRIQNLRDVARRISSLR